MFCANCGHDAKEAKFCPECGTPIGLPGSAPASEAAQPAGTQPASKSHYEEVVLWEGKPAGVGDKVKGKLNTTRYKVTNQRIIISGGLIGKKESEVELHRVKDIKVKQSLTDRMAKVGDITVYSSDITLGDFELTNVPDVLNVKEIIRKAVMDTRANLNIVHHDKV